MCAENVESNMMLIMCDNMGNIAGKAHLKIRFQHLSESTGKCIRNVEI
jgi:hypothetical protein